MSFSPIYQVKKQVEGIMYTVIRYLCCISPGVLTCLTKFMPVILSLSLWDRKQADILDNNMTNVHTWKREAWWVFRETLDQLVFCLWGRRTAARKLLFTESTSPFPALGVFFCLQFFYNWICLSNSLNWIQRWVFK